ncbi:sensor domain-containing diguanylate cyclase [Sporosarcina gallistercoris]|uniref:Sensor domain-containing diguanylate cyclase n=1 Tax=Sporosarcina gallistercoris TaxID=2762245 RepID=A0ABR8PJQ8_9BACL|nr:sensor domain-containing diguanylate cyclase [Sporosarcina gallistercoris]MBD7908400.1 sensor domain-containing diguanylate cyclase [Sporosarcina gallistercoris]
MKKMKLKGRQLMLLFLTWIIVVPTGIVYLLHTQPVPTVNWLWVGLSVLLGFLSLHYPIIYNRKPVSLFVWFTLPIFIMYGLTIELIITQVIIALAVFARLKKGNILFRFLYNSLAYFILSVCAAIAFFLTGAKTGEMDMGKLVVSVVVYQIVYSFLYDWISKLYEVLTHRKRRGSVKETLLHYFRMIIAVPLALSLYFVLIHYGAIGYLLVGIPFFFMTILLRINRKTDDLNAYIQAAGKIGQQLAKMTTEEAVVQEFMTKTTALFKAEYVYLFKHYDGWLEPTHFYVEARKVDVPQVRLENGEGIAGKVLSNKNRFLYSRREQWIERSMTTVPADLESLLCVPLIRHQEIVGALVLGSKKRDGFKEFHLNVLDLLSSYFIVAVEKARYIERAEQQSNRCALTGLYNYRFLEQHLKHEMALIHKGVHQHVAVVMLDIDHFKKVNDTYGHECGNLILKQFAHLLQNECPENGIVARYGGEEFVYILPGYSAATALGFAEELRSVIEQTNMRIENDLSGPMSKEQLQITASIGVSAAPEDTDEAMTLLRNADRALYIGAKQAGRNRVGGYVK